MNIWHQIEKSRITPTDFVAMIEVSKGSKIKYELDKNTGLVILDRILRTSTQYPTNYGFIPRTLSEDGDALDVLVLCSESISPHVLVRCRPIGVVEMIDGGAKDEKIIAVAIGDPHFCNFDDIADIPVYMKKEIEHFLSVYKAFDNISIEVKDAQDKQAAIRIIEKSLVMYNNKFDN